MMRKLSLAIVAVFLMTSVMVVFAANTIKPPVSWDSASATFKNLTTGASGMEYSTNSGTSWTSVASTTMPGTPGATYWFRFKGDTDENFYAKITVPGSVGAPSGLTYANGKISGVDSSMEYNAVSATNNTWAQCYGSQITVTLSSSPQTYYVRYKATATSSASAATAVSVPAASVSNSSSVIRDFENELFITDDAGWFYTTISATYTGEYLYPFTYDATSKKYTTKMLPDSTYYLRKSGDSSGTAVTTPKRPTPPAGLGYDPVTQTITGVTGTTTFRYRVAAGITTTNFANLTPTTVIPLKDLEQTIYVAYKATETNFASHNTAIKLWAKPGVSDEFNAVHYENGKIVGVTDAMEYQIIATDKAEDLKDDGWEPCTGSYTSLTRTSSEQYVFIRLKAVGGGNPSAAIMVKVPLVLPQPVVALDLVNGVMTGLDPSLSYVYRAGTSGSFKDIANALITEDKTTFVVNSLLKGKELTLQIAQKPAAGVPDPDSITAVKISAAPTMSKQTIKGYSADDNGTGYATVSGLKKGMQFKPEHDRSWSEPMADDKDIRLPVGYTAATYVFRYAPTQDTAADEIATASATYIQGSKESKIKLAAPVKPPAVKVDYKKEQINLKTGLAYSLDGVTWTTLSSQKLLSLKDDQLYGSILFVRTAATVKKPASDITTVRVNPRMPSAPTDNDVFITLVKNKPTVVMSAGARQIEYFEAGKWKKGVPKYDKLGVEIRFMADPNHGPSESAYLTKDGIS